MAEGDPNGELIETLKQSFDKLQTTFKEQATKTHQELLSVNSTLKENAKTNTSPKGTSALGRSPAFSGNESEALEFLEQFNVFADF